MKIDVKIPSPGESITQVQIASWLVENNEFVEKDQEITEIDSDKATLTISAEEDGKIEILVEKGETVDVGAVVARIDTSVKGEKKTISEEKESEEKKSIPQAKELQQEEKSNQKSIPKKKTKESQLLNVSPLAKKIMEINDVSESELISFFKKFRLSKKDVEYFLEKKDAASHTKTNDTDWGGTRDTERVKMSTLRMKLAERLVAVKNETAMLTTFNEIRMTPIMEIRKKYKKAFEEKHGIGLGFMSFFTKAVAEALRIFPQMNAQIEGNEIVRFKYADIGIAVSAPKGLMVPIIRNAETLGFAEIELKIKELADKARNNKISLEEMQGGTFTITNGGVFGSMLSTPIINPPQSAILGMHNIVERPVAIKGKVEIHPVMYLALSYDHRIIDGKDSVSFLVKIKEMLEDPVKLILGGKDPERMMLGL